MAKPLTPADLPEDLARFAEARIAAGLSVDVEDVLRAGKAALEAEQGRRDAKLAKLREAIDEGDASGVAEDSSLEAILRDIRPPAGRSSSGGRQYTQCPMHLGDAGRVHRPAT